VTDVLVERYWQQHWQQQREQEGEEGGEQGQEQWQAAEGEGGVSGASDDDEQQDMVDAQASMQQQYGAHVTALQAAVYSTPYLSDRKGLQIRPGRPVRLSSSLVDSLGFIASPWELCQLAAAGNLEVLLEFEVEGVLQQEPALTQLQWWVGL
jgi:hypothetical protein